MRKYAFFLIVFGGLCGGCSTGERWAYSQRTYLDNNAYANPRKLGPVRAESCQTSILYLFPYGKAATATKAIAAARTKRQGTVFLADMTVEKITKVRFFYSVECVIVTAIAYTADPVAKQVVVPRADALGAAARNECDAQPPNLAPCPASSFR